MRGSEVSTSVLKCSWVKFKWEEVKCRQVYWSVVKILVTGCPTLSEDLYRSYEVCCLYGCFIYHILLVPIFIIVYMVVLLYVSMYAVNKYVVQYHVIYHNIFKIGGISWLSVLRICSEYLLLTHSVPVERLWNCYQSIEVVILLYWMRK